MGWVKRQKKQRFSTKRLNRYISETIEGLHSYNGTLMGNRIGLWIGTNFDDLKRPSVRPSVRHKPLLYEAD